MSKLTYDFSILEPVTSNAEFAEKVTDPIYPTLFSIFSLKRLLAIYYIDRFAKKGVFTETGRYRLEIKIVGVYVHARLIRSL